MILFSIFLTFTIYQIELTGFLQQEAIVPKRYITYSDPHIKFQISTNIVAVPL